MTYINRIDLILIIFLFLFLCLFLCLCLGCAQYGPEGFSTFGSASIVADLDTDGKPKRIEVVSDGTNVFKIFDGAFDAVLAFFGRGNTAPEITINMPDAEEPREPAEVEEISI